MSIKEVEYRGYLQDGISYLYRTEGRTTYLKDLSGSVNQKISGCSTLFKLLHVTGLAIEVIRI